MKYTVVSSAEFCYPDRFVYASSADSADVFGARGGYASFQVMLEGVESEALSVSAVGFEAEIYSLYPVYVEKNVKADELGDHPHMPERKAPYYVYDALMPYRGKVKVTDNRAGLYVAVPISSDAAPGVISGTLFAGDVSVPVSVEITAARVPAETLKIIQGYWPSFTRYHGVAGGTEEFARLDGEYLRCLRRMHQNMMYTGGVRVTELGDDRYEFDFAGLENQIRHFEAHGMRYFNLPPIGGRKGWHESTIYVNDLPSMSYAAYRYLSQYLPALRACLAKNNWLDRCYMGICDEPNEYNATEFRALCGLVRRFLPEVRLLDAMSCTEVYGALNVFVPKNSEYEEHRAEMETLRENGDELWYYVCCLPRKAPYINRFTDYALLCTRALHWGNYRYRMPGYLHWAANCYVQNVLDTKGEKREPQDPFICSCPTLMNVDSLCPLPAGDTHLLYPGGFNGNGEVQEPWLSIRAENQRESAEEYELLRALSVKSKPLADAICKKFFRSFGDIEYDVNRFDAIRRELMDACGKLL